MYVSIHSNAAEMDPVIVVPWQVLKELDYIKGKNCSESATKLSSAARSASNFILSHSNSIQCQSQKMSNEVCPEFVVEVADDNIIKCALQMKLQNHNVVRMTNLKGIHLCRGGRFILISILLGFGVQR